MMTFINNDLFNNINIKSTGLMLNYNHTITINIIVIRFIRKLNWIKYIDNILGVMNLAIVRVKKGRALQQDREMRIV